MSDVSGYGAESMASDDIKRVVAIFTDHIVRLTNERDEWQRKYAAEEDWKRKFAAEAQRRFQLWEATGELVDHLMDEHRAEIIETTGMASRVREVVELLGGPFVGYLNDLGSDAR